MATVNIPSYHDDPNYRYRMPRVKAKVEGRGNGVKTNIMNMGDIARALKRAPEYATKFCGCELGASSKFEMAEGKAIVNGIHSEADVQIVIDKFVDRFVLCPKCRLPEIDLMVNKGRVQGVCNACGFAGDMDNVHKVATFIVKNPPAVTDSTVGKKSAGGASGKKSTDDTKKSSRKSATLAESAGSDADSAAQVSDGEGAEKRRKSKSSSSKSKDGSSSKDKDKKESKKKHHHRHHHHHHHHQLGYDAEELEKVIERLTHFLTKAERPTPNDFFQEVRLLQVAQDFSGAVRVYCAITALHRALCGGTSDNVLTVENLQAINSHIKATCDRSIDGSMILEALEQFALRQQPEKMWKGYAVLLNALYQMDILEEDAVLERYGEDQEPAPIYEDPHASKSKRKSKHGSSADGENENDGALSETSSSKKVDAPKPTTETSIAPQQTTASTIPFNQGHILGYRSAVVFVKWLKEAESASDDDEH